jgi:DNA invertase Pin-like site-specific DNA recombinase
MKSTKIGVIYARYSSSVQTEQSIEGQVRECFAYAQRNGIAILDTYVDRATTGTNDKRESFQKMLKDAHNGAWDCVLVYKLDRFSRNKYEMAIHRKALRDNGVKLISATENIPDSPEGVILETVLEGLAEYYSLDISQKTKRGKRESRLKGNFQGGAITYGYKVEKVNGEHKVLVCEEGAAIVRRIFDECVLGRSSEAIAKGLNDDGIRNSKGRRFISRTVRHVLNNEKYIGIYRHKEDGVYEGIYPRIISDETFYKVQSILKLNRCGSSSIEDPYLLRGKAICGYCGSKIRGDGSKNGQGESARYYVCSKRRKGGDCIKSYVSKKALEALVVRITVKALSTPENLDLLTEKIYEMSQTKHQDVVALQTLINEREKCKQGIKNLLNAFQKGIVTRYLKEHLDECEERLHELEKKIEFYAVRARKEISREEIRENLEVAMKQEAAMLIRLLIKKVVVYNDKIEIYFNGVENGSPDENSHQGWFFYSETVNFNGGEIEVVLGV